MNINSLHLAVIPVRSNNVEVEVRRNLLIAGKLRCVMLFRKYHIEF